MNNVINIIKEEILNHLKENQYQDNALDKINKVGGFNKLPDIDKLALLSDSGKYDELKKLDLGQIYKENGGTFGRFNIKVMVKPVNEQPVKHKFSQESQNKVGWLYPYFNYNNQNKPYITVRFEEFKSDYDMKGGGTYNEMPIMLDNLFPIAITDVKSEFVDYDRKINIDRSDFLSAMGIEPNDF